MWALRSNVQTKYKYCVKIIKPQAEKQHLLTVCLVKSRQKPPIKMLTNVVEQKRDVSQGKKYLPSNTFWALWKKVKKKSNQLQNCLKIWLSYNEENLFPKTRHLYFWCFSLESSYRSNGLILTKWKKNQTFIEIEWNKDSHNWGMIEQWFPKDFLMYLPDNQTDGPVWKELYLKQWKNLIQTTTMGNEFVKYFSCARGKKKRTNIYEHK